METKMKETIKKVLEMYALSFRLIITCHLPPRFLNVAINFPFIVPSVCQESMNSELRYIDHEY